MVAATTHERVDAFWVRTFDIPGGDLHRAGVGVVAHTGTRAAWNGIYVLAIGGAAHVFAPAGLIGRLTVALRGRDAASLLEPCTWYDVLSGRIARILGPSAHHYLDDPAALATVARGARRLNPGDFASLVALQGAADPAEWEEAGLAEQASLLFGIFEDEQPPDGGVPPAGARSAGAGPSTGGLVAAANLTDGPAPACDIGVFTRSDARGHGLASRVAAAAARQSLLMNGIARYRARADHHASVSVARRLGFTEYGRNLAVHLT